MEQMNFREAADYLGRLRTSIKGLSEGAAPADYHDSEPGEGGAENISDVLEQLDTYLAEVVSELLDKFDMSEDDAYDFLFSVADALVEEGLLPALPEDEDKATDEQYIEWFGKARSVNFSGLVLQAAEEAAEESD